MNPLNPIKILNIVKRQPVKRQHLPQLKVEAQTDEGIHLHNTATQILQRSFVKCILGRPQSGKSTLVEHMIKSPEFYANKFDRILYVGPTQYNIFPGNKNPIIQDQFNWRSSFDSSWIFEQIQACNKWNCRNMLIVFDDVISYMKDSSMNKQSSELFFNRRHLLHNGCISIIVTSQKWTSFPKFIRAVCTSLIIFNVNKYEAQSVWKQTSMTLSRPNFCFLVGQLKSHQFCFVNFKSNKMFNTKWEMI